MSRLFSNRQRKTLYVMSGGTCSKCGAPLEKGWHGDHVTPHSKGGETELINGQALCPKCNLKKGASMDGLSPWPQTVKLRNWQEQAVMAFNKHDKHNHVSVVKADALEVLHPGDDPGDGGRRH